MSNRIIGVMLGTLGGAALTLASAASAQQGGGPPPVIPGAGGGPRAQDVAAANRAVDSDYNTLAGRGVEVTSDKSRANSRPRGPVVALAADFIVGASVRDRNGAQIATVEGLETDGAVVKAGDRLAKLPLDAFGKDDAGLLLGITAAEFQAAIAQSSVPATAAQAEEFADAAPSDMLPGASVRDIDGVPIGTVEEMIDSGVILLIDGRKVKLALDSFAKDEDGLLIGVTASEFKAMIGNRTGATPGA
jgi:hypothetical protein